MIRGFGGFRSVLSLVYFLKKKNSLVYELQPSI